MKQIDIFGNENSKVGGKYTNKIETPIYEPKNIKPSILALIDNSKTKRLITEIKNSNVSEDEKTFLIQSAKRHLVFNYASIADYYSHSSKEMQHLMEKSALVIVDFEKAIHYNYMKLSNDLMKTYLDEPSNGK